MHRVDVPSAAAGGLFTEGSPAGGVPATIVPADWLNDLQENVAQAIELSGIPLAKGDYTQLYAAILARAGALLPKRSFTANDFIRLPDAPGGLIVNFGSALVSASNVATVLTLPRAWDNGLLQGATTLSGSGNATAAAGLEAVPGSLTQIRLYQASAQAQVIRYIAIGW